VHIVRLASTSVGFDARLAYFFVEISRSTAEHTDIILLKKKQLSYFRFVTHQQRDLFMFLLDVFEKSAKIWSPKVIHRLQVSEHASTTVAAEMFFANVLNCESIDICH
jgi:hypothetical protein